MAGNCLVHVYLFLTSNSNLKQHRIFKISYFHKFTYSLSKTIYPQIYWKSPKNITTKARNVDTRDKQIYFWLFERLKREWDALKPLIIPSQNKAFRCSSRVSQYQPSTRCKHWIVHHWSDNLVHKGLSLPWDREIDRWSRERGCWTDNRTAHNSNISVLQHEASRYHPRDRKIAHEI